MTAAETERFFQVDVATSKAPTLDAINEAVAYARRPPGWLATNFQSMMEWCCGLVDEDARASHPNRLRTLDGKDMQYEDFSGTIRMGAPTEFHLPESRAQVVATIREAARAGRKVRFAGEGHCAVPHVVSKDLFVLCDKLQHVELDVKSKTVRAEAGLSMNQLVHLLAKSGLVLPSNTVYTSGQLGGLLATGSHGGGLKYGALADWVLSIDIIDGTGRMRRFVRPNSSWQEKGFLEKGFTDTEPLVDECKDDARIWSCVLQNLGLFGCIYAVRFEAHDMFHIHWVDKFVPIEGTMEPENIKKLVESHEFVEIFWWPFTDKVELKKYTRTDEPLSVCPCCSTGNCCEGIVGTFCCGRQGERVGWMADLRDLRKSWDGISAAVGGKLMGAVVSRPQLTPALTKMISTFMASQDRVTIAPEGIHFNCYIPSMKVWLLEVAFIISPGYENVYEMFNFIREATERYARDGRYPFNIALELRFAGAGAAKLYHGHVKDFTPLPNVHRVVPMPMEEYMNRFPDRTKLCYFEIVTAQGSPHWFDFATEICKKAMSLPGGYGRPHWGKFFPHNDAGVVRKLHEHIRAQGNGIVEMLKVRKELNMDPYDMFINQYLQTRVIDPALALESGQPIPPMPDIPYTDGAKQATVAARSRE